MTLDIYMDSIRRLDKVYWMLLFLKATLSEKVCSRLIKPTIQTCLSNVGLLTRLTTCYTIVQTCVQREEMLNIV
jgi:hypothetical protein